MIAYKNISKIVAVVMAGAVCFCLVMSSKLDSLLEHVLLASVLLKLVHLL